MKTPLFHHDKNVIHCGHHKAGSYWIARIFSTMCAESGNDLAIIEGTRNNMSQYPGQRYFYDNNSTFIVDVENCVGTHMIRDPRDLVISGYFYHQWTKETGYLFHNDKWGMSYQEMVKTLPKEEGIKFEMDNKAAQTIAEMRRWNYNDPRFMEMKYVDLITGPNCRIYQNVQPLGS